MVITASYVCLSTASDHTILHVHPFVTLRSNLSGIARGPGLSSKLLRQLGNQSIIKAIGVRVTADRYEIIRINGKQEGREGKGM